MKAAVIKDYEAPVEISEVDAPALADDSVLVDVHAASLNPIDNILRAGHLKEMIPLQFPHVMAYDVSGVVRAVGKDVTGFKVGDRVFARPNQEDAGALAEVARVKAAELALNPANLTHAETASIPLAGLTAWQALVDKAGVQPGQKVLIHAGSGGVGTLAIQIAKHLGAYVATTVSPRNAELVRSLGADEVIDYHSQDFAQLLSDYDMVFDMLGGETLEKSFKILKKGGHLVSIKGQDEKDQAKDYGVKFDWFFMEPNGTQLTTLAGLLEDGTLKPVIDSEFAMADVAAAYDKLADGHAVGKIVVNVAA
ncbi:NADP-dependent oxidoreductase [Loktanella agnita]|uniref:NADP-dependent oxidoreductase n=1 Tax=Loktanella agnita TaxID=287097 RepID=UPI0039876E9E